MTRVAVMSDEVEVYYKQMLNTKEIPVKLRDVYGRCKHMIDRCSGGDRFSPHLLVLIALCAGCEVRPSEPVVAEPPPKTPEPPKRGPGRPKKELQPAQ